jgi:mRNA N6-methyladenine demethylase
VEPIAEPIQALIDALYNRGVISDPNRRPNQCTINIYEEGNWLPAHIDNREFSRPIITTSLLSEQEMVMGEKIILTEDGMFKDVQFRLRLPIGSVVCLGGNAADLAQHAVPAASSKRISFTLRHLPDHINVQQSQY